MHKKCSRKLRKIPCHVKPTETNSRQRFQISRVNFWLMQVTMQSTFVTSNESTVGRFQSSNLSENGILIPMLQSVPN